MNATTNEIELFDAMIEIKCHPCLRFSGFSITLFLPNGFLHNASAIPLVLCLVALFQVCLQSEHMEPRPWAMAGQVPVCVGCFVDSDHGFVVFQHKLFLKPRDAFPNSRLRFKLLAPNRPIQLRSYTKGRPAQYGIWLYVQLGLICTALLTYFESRCNLTMEPGVKPLMHRLELRVQSITGK